MIVEAEPFDAIFSDGGGAASSTTMVPSADMR